MHKIHIGQKLSSIGLDMGKFMEWFELEGEYNEVYPDGMPNIPYYEVERYIRLQEARLI